MNLRTWTAAAGLLFLLASSGCGAPQDTRDYSAPAQPGKEVCQRDNDCSWMFKCTSEHRCTCQVDGDCAATQRCLKSSGASGGICRFR
jgi:hypothetical protein